MKKLLLPLAFVSGVGFANDQGIGEQQRPEKPERPEVCERPEVPKGKGAVVREIIESRKEGQAELRADVKAKNEALREAGKTGDKEQIDAAAEELNQARQALRDYNRETHEMIMDALKPDQELFKACFPLPTPEIPEIPETEIN